MLDNWPDSCALRAWPVRPALEAAAAEHALSCLQKLLNIFVQEGAILRGTAQCVAQAAVLMVVFEPSGAALSGCRHDRIHGVLRKVERDHQCQILGLPPLAVGLGQHLVLGTRAQLRKALSQGTLSAESPWWPLAVHDLGSWRAEAGKALAQTPIGRQLLTRH